MGNSQRLGDFEKTRNLKTPTEGEIAEVIMKGGNGKINHFEILSGLFEDCISNIFTLKAT
jgi:hypothetical protein